MQHPIILRIITAALLIGSFFTRKASRLRRSTIRSETSVRPHQKIWFVLFMLTDMSDCQLLMKTVYLQEKRQIYPSVIKLENLSSSKDGRNRTSLRSVIKSVLPLYIPVILTMQYKFQRVSTYITLHQLPHAKFDKVLKLPQINIIICMDNKWSSGRRLEAVIMNILNGLAFFLQSSRFIQQAKELDLRLTDKYWIHPIMLNVFYPLTVGLLLHPYRILCNQMKKRHIFYSLFHKTVVIFVFMTLSGGAATLVSVFVDVSISP